MISLIQDNAALIAAGTGFHYSMLYSLLINYVTIMSFFHEHINPDSQ